MDTLQTEKLLIAEDKISNSIEISIRDEDYTLGCALVDELQRRSEVAFTAYKIPHPLQNILKVKVTAETIENKPVELVKSSLDNLIQDCDTLFSYIYK